ncbi:hypothetical protein ACLOJK_007353 [Asimina triloba]
MPVEIELLSADLNNFEVLFPALLFSELELLNLSSFPQESRIHELRQQLQLGSSSSSLSREGKCLKEKALAALGGARQGV